MSHGFEAMLLRWSETSNGGATIVLQLSDAADLEQFKSITQAKKGKDGHMVGQRLMIGWSEIGEDEQPKDGAPKVDDASKGGALARLAGMWCQDVVFRVWLIETFPDAWHRHPDGVDGHEQAAACVRELCAVTSRVELDHNARARETFNNLIRIPYSQYLKENP